MQLQTQTHTHTRLQTNKHTHTHTHKHIYVQDTLIAVNDNLIPDAHTHLQISSMLQERNNRDQVTVLWLQKRNSRTETTSAVYDHGASLRYEVAKLKAMCDDGLIAHADYTEKLQTLLKLCHKVMYIYIYMFFFCVCVCSFVYMYACTYLCRNLFCFDGSIGLCMLVCMYVYMHTHAYIHT